MRALIILAGAGLELLLVLRILLRAPPATSRSSASVSSDSRRPSCRPASTSPSIAPVSWSSVISKPAERTLDVRPAVGRARRADIRIARPKPASDKASKT